MLCIKTGMQNEYELAKKYASPNTLVLTGIQSVEDLQNNVPKGCTAIMSFGMSGGLRPVSPIVGQTVVASYLEGPKGERYICDITWRLRLHMMIGDAGQTYCSQPYYSSGKFNEANTPAQRQKIFQETGTWCIDDESLWVAQFAEARDIPFTIVRNVSDQWDDDVSFSSNLLLPSGGANPWGVAKALITQPIAMTTMAYHFFISQRALEETAKLMAPSFGWVENESH